MDGKDDVSRGRFKPIIFFTLTQEQYLHGHCNEYVECIFQEGDKIISLIEFDEELEKNCILHCFIQRKDKYVDARGELSTLQEVLDDFDYGQYDTFEHTTLEEFRSFINEILYYQ